MALRSTRHVAAALALGLAGAVGGTAALEGAAGAGGAGTLAPAQERRAASLVPDWWVPEGFALLNRLLSRGDSYVSMAWP